MAAKTRPAADYEKIEIRSREQLRAWLARHHEREQGIWLIHYKKHRPEYYLPWGEIVDECLCYGWIDGLVRKLDEDRTMHLISPRKQGSPWSRINKDKVVALEREGLMTDAGRTVIARAKADGSWTVLDDVEAMILPDDLVVALRKRARKKWDAFPDSSKKAILWWIKSAKTDKTRAKRIAQTVARAKVGLRANFPEDEKKWKARQG